jgi:hypothetical protein
MDWQPIETAPRDGTRVLLTLKYDDEPIIGRTVARIWCTDEETWEGGWHKEIEPTHWMPLPAIAMETAKPPRRETGLAR